MSRRLLILVIIILCCIAPCLAESFSRFYLAGYSPLIYNQIDIYKINNGLNFNKKKPYLIPSFGTTTTKTLDFENEKVVISTRIGDEDIYPEVVLSFDAYIAGIQSNVFHTTLIGKVLLIPDQAASQTGGLIKDITIDLPNVAIPKSIRRILGNKAGRLNLDGSQKITLSGTSTKRKNVPNSQLSQGSRFELKMQQDTNLNLSGTIGEKIQVNLKYNSNQDEALFNPNNINIKYTGDEDEVVQSIEAGNISLALSGSKYISYSASSQGLFGITSKLKVGALDLTMIASKEEGQKNTSTYIGQSQADSTIIFSKNFTPRTFYYLEKPQDIYELYTADDALSSPPSWKDNAIKTTNGIWNVAHPEKLPKGGTVKVYIDNADATDDVGTQPGDSVFVNPYTGFTPYYEEIFEFTDFITDPAKGTIEILKPIDSDYTIAVKYTRVDGTLVPPNNNVLDGKLHLKVLRVGNQVFDSTYVNNTWDYQMRNVYYMGIDNIENDEDFRLDIYTIEPSGAKNNYVPEKFKYAANNINILTFNDYLRLDSSGVGNIVNGDDAAVNLATGFITIPFIKPFEKLGDVDMYREEPETLTYPGYTHSISVKGKIGRDIISLGQTGILKGSVKVKVDGTTLKENGDYIVDYDMGQVTFLAGAGKDPKAKIEIDYEYRSGFAVAQKSLAGVRADWNLSDNSKIGGTVMYRSENVDEKRPKIGSENMKLFLADIDGSTSWKPGFITKWIDALPLIRTSAESKISLSGEVAITIPDISGDSKHKNEAYIDDMEGILDSYPLGLTFYSWVPGSKPWQTSLPKGRINWYNPADIKMNQVYADSTLNLNERDQATTVLTLKVIPNYLLQPGITNWSWGGIMKYVGKQLDFSNKKYIELLVKVPKNQNDINLQRNVTLHVDLGDISEDFYTEYGGLGILNTEDKILNGELDKDEDIGLDMIKGVKGNPPGDDLNDDYGYTSNSKDYSKINGTEGNNTVDTEDLDNNKYLNVIDQYLSYSVNLPRFDDNNHYIPNLYPYITSYIDTTEFMLIRLPLNDKSIYETVINPPSSIPPSLKKVSYIRIWAESNDSTEIMIASASIVGNKWEDNHIRDLSGSIVNTIDLIVKDESYISGIIDNQKSGHYSPPKNTLYKDASSTTTPIEQSLTLTTQNLQPGHQVLLKQKLMDYYDLRSYGKLRFWVFPEVKQGIQNYPDSMDIIFRLGADSLNYYQVRQPVNVINYATEMDDDKWESIDCNLQDFSGIKDTLALGEEFYFDGKYYSYKGIPTLSNIKEFVLGVQNESENDPYTGITYFDDIRVADPYEDMGWAGRVTLNTIFADFATFDVEYEKKSLNFNPTIQRGRTQSTGFADSNALRLANKLFLDKFFPESWGIKLPLSLDRNYTKTIPRYRANSDVLRSKISDPLDKAREMNENLNYSAALAVSQVTVSKSPLLAYTLNKMSMNGKVSQTNNNTATSRDSTFSWLGTYNYNVNLPENLFSIPISKSYKLHYLPGGFTNSFTINSSEPLSYNWENRDTLSGWFPRPQTYPTKYINTDNGTTWALTSDVNTSYRLLTKRDLMQKNYYKSYNVGKETEFNQDIGANYSPSFFPNFFTLTSSIASRYTENQRKYTENVLGEIVDIYQKDGNSTRTTRMNFTLLNSTIFSDLATKKDNPNGSDDAKKKNEQEKNVYKDNKENEKDKGMPDYLKTDDKGVSDKEELINVDKSIDVKEENIEKELDIKERRNKEAEQSIEPKGDDSDSINKGNEIIATDSLTIKQNNKEDVKPNHTFSPLEIFLWLSKIKNVTATYQNGYTQLFTRRTRRPNFAFQLGLPNQVPGGFLDSKSNEDTYTLASGITFSRRIDSTLNYSYSITQRYASASNQIVSITFPDITLTVSELESIFGLSKYLENTRLNSNYQYTLKQNGDINWAKPKQETRTMSFNPLVSLTTNIAQKVQTTLSLNVSNSENITDMTIFQIVRKSDSQNVSGNFSYSFKSSKGIEIPFTKRKINIKNELTSSLAITYENNYEKTFGQFDSQVDRFTTRISFSPTATYQFDQNIKGSFTSGYELTTDKKKDDYTRIFRLGISVEITL